MLVSIIIPAYNEEKNIREMLQRLQDFRAKGNEIIIADAGSHDNTTEIVRPLADKIIRCKKGRALQMNTAAKQARFDIFWFLHADTLVPADALELINSALQNNYEWGRFNIRLSGNALFFRIIENMINLRSRLTGIATGDQGIFVKRTSFYAVQGYKNIPLMEDIDISKKLKKISSPACLKQRLITSSRRWEEHGIIKTIILMWQLRLLYFLGVSADKLATKYR